MIKMKGGDEVHQESDDDPYLLGDSEEELWEFLDDYASRRVSSEEKEHYAQVVLTLHKKFGRSYKEMEDRTGGAKTASAFKKSVERVFGKLESTPKKAIKVASKKIDEIVAKEVGNQVVENQELGKWLRDCYGPIAQGFGMGIKEYVGQSMNFIIYEKKDLDEWVVRVVEDSINQKLLIDELIKYVAPNFLKAEKMRLIERFWEFITFMAANGITVPPELSFLLTEALDDIERKYIGK